MSSGPQPKEKFLDSTDVVDWQHPAVRAMAAELSQSGDAVATARACFVFVRDEIKHSRDYEMNPATWRASDVLKHGTGYCYAKSHLLAALLRANGISAGFCYQRLSVNDRGAPFSLHGYNAVWLPEIGWYRADARGNKPGVAADSYRQSSSWHSSSTLPTSWTSRTSCPSRLAAWWAHCRRATAGKTFYRVCPM